METRYTLRMELSDEEREILEGALGDSLPKLDIEIHRTDVLEFKRSLQHRRDVLSGLLTKLSHLEPVGGK